MQKLARSALPPSVARLARYTGLELRSGLPLGFDVVKVWQLRCLGLVGTSRAVEVASGNPKARSDLGP
jgi:hypothetical protein